MINFLLKIKLLRKCKTFPTSNGMTYVELIVVLSIFAVMSSIVMFNYSGFQAKIDIKNLASDIALKVVQAQKPSYGVYFDITSDSNKRSFVYFVDLDYTTPPQNGFFDGSGSGCTFECIEQITMTRGDYISSLEVFYQDNFVPEGLNDLTISFSRPNSGAVIKSSTVFSGIISYVQITISTPNSTTAKIKLYPSGRIQVN